MATKEKVKVEEKTDLADKKVTDKEIEAAADKIIAGQSPELEDFKKIVAANALALSRIAEQQIPQNVQQHLDKQQAEYENPYIIVEDKVVVLTVSTVDLASIDGWPGYVDELIPGKFTRQNLQMRIRFPVEINYEPSLERRYDSVVMDREEFEKMRQHSPGGTIPHASMVASMSLRAGADRG